MHSFIECLVGASDVPRLTWYNVGKNKQTKSISVPAFMKFERENGYIKANISQVIMLMFYNFIQILWNEEKLIYEHEQLRTITQA